MRSASAFSNSISCVRTSSSPLLGWISRQTEIYFSGKTLSRAKSPECKILSVTLSFGRNGFYVFPQICSSLVSLNWSRKEFDKYFDQNTFATCSNRQMADDSWVPGRGNYVLVMERRKSGILDNIAGLFIFKFIHIWHSVRISASYTYFTHIFQ